jgi:hypothetical protein
MSQNSKAATRIGRTVGVVVVVALLVAAVSASAAQAAARWKVNGSFLGAGVAKSFTAVGKGATFKQGVNWYCPESKVAGQIEGTAAGTKGKASQVVFTYTGCAVRLANGGSTPCKIEQEGQPVGTLQTKPLNGILGWRAGGAGPMITFTPEKGNALTSGIKIGGENCAFETGEGVPLQGSMTPWLTPTSGEATSMAAVFPETGGLSAIKWEGAVTLVTQTTMTLASGGAFGVAEG